MPRTPRILPPAPPAEPRRLRFSAALPGVDGTPLLRLSVEAEEQPETGGGDRLRLRAHVQANFASALKPALGALAARARQASGQVQAALPNPDRLPPPLVQALAPMARRAQGWLDRRVTAAAPRVAQALAPLLAHDTQTWFEVHASTAPLAQGARALLPQVAQLAALGISPRTDANAPPVEQWMGRIGNELAQVATLRLDETHLPTELRRTLGGQPFQLAAALVNVVSRRGV